MAKWVFWSIRELDYFCLEILDFDTHFNECSVRKTGEAGDELAYADPSERCFIYIFGLSTVEVAVAVAVVVTSRTIIVF